VQIFGTSHLEQVYNIRSYILVSPSKYLTPSNRLIPPNYAKAFLPALAISDVIPTMCSYWLTFTLNTLQFWDFLQQLGTSGLYSSIKISPSHHA
jgi:hypothetical protein